MPVFSLRAQLVLGRGRRLPSQIGGEALAQIARGRGRRLVVQLLLKHRVVQLGLKDGEGGMGKVRGKASAERGTRAITSGDRNAQINAKNSITIRVHIRNTNKNIQHAKATKNTKSSHGSNKF